MIREASRKRENRAFQSVRETEKLFEGELEGVIRIRKSSSE